MKYALACALALAAVVATYANHFHNAFHFDDSHTIQNNIYIRDVRNIPRFFTRASTFSSIPTHQSYRPLVTTTLAIDYRWGGLNPLAFHVTSFALFVVQCALMLTLFRQVMDRARPDEANRWIALGATTWYALHAANAETVNYLIARSEILSTLGVVTALVMFAGGRSRNAGLYLIPAAAAVLAKEQGAMFAPLLFLYVAFFERERSVRELTRPRELVAALRVTWPAFVVCGTILGVGLRLASTFRPGGGSRWTYLITQPFVIAHYALTFFLPVHLSADADWTPIANPLDVRVIVGVVFIVCAIGAAVAASSRKETRPIAFGVLWFFLALLPTSSLVSLSEVMNDHRVYFPFVGLTLAVWWGAALPLTRAGAATRATVFGAAVAALVAMAYGTHQRNEVWRTEESLWLDVTHKSPANARGLMNYGAVQMGKGNLAVAEQYFDRALQYAPNYAYLHVNLGVLKDALGQAAEAERHFREAQQDDPQDPATYLFYARWLRSAGRTDEAIAQARRALAVSPGDADAQQLLLEMVSSPAATRSPRSFPQ